ncbi:flagellar biosynthetic protein FliR [Litorisediminicola beolgyonensis]|uniref:Flagellar biosynthetic protein FliR n=1 Tax=Litorisediminicola beolgyonensis TaxID=1173614 RepID=A0ABW3ZFT9_9RHOB
MDLSVFLTSQIIGVGVIFARIGAIFLFMPAFGEQAIPNRHKLALALLLCIALSPAIGIGPLDLSRPVDLIAIFGLEITVGLWLGLTARIVMSAVSFAGYQIGMVSGLANALAPSQGAFEGATLVASILTLAATALIFATDTHHLILGAIMMSYDVFPVGQLMPYDLADQIIRAAAMSLYLGVTLAAPFYVLQLVMNTGLGLANRLMATLPVFFVATPLLLGAGLAVMSIALPSVIAGFLAAFTGWLGTLAF